MVNPCIPERGIAELDWVLEHGAKVVLLRPGPVAGTRGTRSPFLPEFDAFWSRVAESGVLVAMHASDSGYQRHANEWEGDGRDMQPFAPRPFTDAVNTGRPISDTVTSAICHGMLSRFPTVRLLSVENGGSWALPLPQVDGEDLREDAQGLRRAPQPRSSSGTSTSTRSGRTRSRRSST